jgi:phthiodiolone/phenolphthiodiolone dimycocerosates ketoreductase
LRGAISAQGGIVRQERLSSSATAPDVAPTHAVTRSSFLQVGIETSCKAPLPVERAKLRLCRMLGVDSLFLPDHLMSAVPSSRRESPGDPVPRWVSSGNAFLEPYVMLGMLATQRPRVRLGVGVTDPLRRNPATVAQAFVTLDHLTRGRAILGLGSGARENIEPYGLPFSNRVAPIEEALTLIRRLWASGGEPVEFCGPTWRMRGAVFATPLYGDRPPVVWLAAHGPQMLGVAGRLADGWYPTVKVSAVEYRSMLNVIHRAAAAAGRRSDTFEPALQVFVAVGRNRRSVVENILRSPAAAGLLLSFSASLWRRHGVEHPLSARDGLPQFLPEEVLPAHIELARRQATPELLTSGIFAGNVREVMEEIQPLVAAGLRHIVLANIGAGFGGVHVTDIVRLAVLIRRLRRLRISRVEAGNEE